MIKQLAGLLLIVAPCVFSAEFQNGQAARAVIAQSSFSAQDGGIAAHALTLYKNHLYAADSNKNIETFDIGKIPGPKDALTDRAGVTCPLCGFAPVAIASQPVMEGIAASAVYGKVIVVADKTNRRVLIWRGTNSGPVSQRPDVILGRGFVEPVSVAYDGKRLFVGDAAMHRVLVWELLPTMDDQPADAVLGQQDFTSATANDLPLAASVGTPAALVSDGTNLFVADSLDRRILVFTPGDLTLPGNAVVSSASLAATAFAPGTLLTIEGNNLADEAVAVEESNVDALPKSLAGVEVSLNGTPLPLLSVSPQQVQVQLPYDLGGASSGSLYVRIEHGNGLVSVSNAVALRFTPAWPGIFGFGGTEPRSGLILHADVQSEASQGAPVSASNPAHPGEVVTVWASGLGLVNNGSGAELAAGVPYDAPGAEVSNPVNAFVNGQPAMVISAILPKGAIGVYEVRILLPSELTPDSAARLLLAQDGNLSNMVTFPLDVSN